ncbi:MAG: hypothetical protein KF712_13700 [Akkermansiaceae bacterium]|nr:hypothetical protein [Akkermansiaceae bacterium]
MDELRIAALQRLPDFGPEGLVKEPVVDFQPRPSVRVELVFSIEGSDFRIVEKSGRPLPIPECVVEGQEILAGQAIVFRRDPVAKENTVHFDHPLPADEFFGERFPDHPDMLPDFVEIDINHRSGGFHISRAVLQVGVFLGGIRDPGEGSAGFVRVAGDAGTDGGRVGVGRWVLRDGGSAAGAVLLASAGPRAIQPSARPQMSARKAGRIFTIPAFSGKAGGPQGDVTSATSCR